MDITPVLPIAGQKFPRYFEGYLEVFAVCKDVYVFIPRFLVEPPKTFCGTLVGKHSLNLWLLTLREVHARTLLKRNYAIERKDWRLLSFKIMENNRTYVSVIRAVRRAGYNGAEIDFR
jgi:hypothetical protein